MVFFSQNEGPIKIISVLESISKTTTLGPDQEFRSAMWKKVQYSLMPREYRVDLVAWVDKM